MSSLNEYKMMSDEDIIADGVSADESGKISELASRYTEQILHIARQYEGSADFHELVSEGLDAFLRAVSTYNGGAGVKFCTYLNVCVHNGMKNVVSRAGRSKTKFTYIPDEELVLIPDPSPTMEEMMVLREQTDDVSYHIRHNLTELERRCINGVILGLSYDEMARQLDTDKKSVDNAVARARAKLRRLCGSDSTNKK